MTQAVSNDVRFQIAHHDIWWAKTHTWHATNWALVLFGAIVSVGALLEVPRNDSEGAAFGLLALFVALFAVWYLARLFDDTVKARYAARKITGGSTLLDLRPPGSKDVPDWRRGAEFVVFLMLVVALGNLLVGWYIANSWRIGVLFGALVFMWGIACLLWALLRARGWPWPESAA